MFFAITSAIAFSIFVFILLFIFWTPKKIIKFFIPKEGSHFTIIDGIKLHYTVHGKAEKDILLIHGIAANIYCWRNLIPLLSKDYRVWAIDLKGFGQSDKPMKSDYGLKAQAELVSSFIQQEIKKTVTLVGSSMGGAISLELALKYPEKVQKLILISPAYDSNLVWLDPRKYKILMPFTKMLANPVFAKSVIKTIYGKKIDTSAETIQAYLSPYLQDRSSHYALMESFSAITDKTLKGRMRGLKIPTLFIWGQNDRAVPVTFAKEAQKLVPYSRLVIHPHGGHHLQEEEPQWLAEQITDGNAKNSQT